MEIRPVKKYKIPSYGKAAAAIAAVTVLSGCTGSISGQPDGTIPEMTDNSLVELDGDVAVETGDISVDGEVDIENFTEYDVGLAGEIETECDPDVEDECPPDESCTVTTAETNETEPVLMGMTAIEIKAEPVPDETELQLDGDIDVPVETEMTDVLELDGEILVEDDIYSDTIANEPSAELNGNRKKPVFGGDGSIDVCIEMGIEDGIYQCDSEIDYLGIVNEAFAGHNMEFVPDYAAINMMGGVWYAVTDFSCREKDLFITVKQSSYAGIFGEIEASDSVIKTDYGIVDRRKYNGRTVTVVYVIADSKDEFVRLITQSTYDLADRGLI